MQVMHLNKEDPFENPLPPIAVNKELNFGWSSPMRDQQVTRTGLPKKKGRLFGSKERRAHHNLEPKSSELRKRLAYEFYNGSFDVIVENAADFDTDENEESDERPHIASARKRELDPVLEEGARDSVEYPEDQDLPYGDEK